MFNETANEIFTEAGVSPGEAPEMFREAVDILSYLMAKLSALHGLSYRRAELYSQQKKTLLEDLRKAKQEGKLH